MKANIAPACNPLRASVPRWVLLASSAGLLHCSWIWPPSMDGRVVDHAGAPLSGATVRADNPAREVTSDAEGKFELPAPKDAERAYVVSLSGYTTHEGTAPDGDGDATAGDIALYPVPTEAGLSHLGGQVALLAPSAIELSAFDPTTGPPAHCRAEPTVTVKAGTSEFVDTRTSPSDQLWLTKVGNDGVVHHVGYDGRVDAESRTVGGEALTVLSAELQPGTYAWLELKDTADGPWPIRGKSSCYPFTVE